MGTTLVLALFTDDKVVTAHVGDSRAYWIRKGEIMQLTQDHTFVAEWLREGLITKEEARTHGQRHGLIEALGVADEVESEVAVWPREQEGCLLLCSDGLTDMLEDEEILAIVESSSDPDTACSELVDAANSKGGLDNITVILVCPEQRAAGSDLE
jgi:protein phosphatase